MNWIMLGMVPGWVWVVILVVALVYVIRNLG